MQKCSLFLSVADAFVSSCVRPHSPFFFYEQQVTWTRLIRGNPDHAWVAKVPTWPLTLVFLAQFVAIAGAVCELHKLSSLFMVSPDVVSCSIGRCGGVKLGCTKPLATVE